MSDLNAFLAETSTAEEPAAAELETVNEAPAEEAAPAEPTTPQADDDTPPEGMDKRAQAIWREEREKRKELQRQVEQMNTRWQQMVERMQAQPQQPQQPPQQQQPQQPEIEIPSFDDDPIGHLRAKNELLERQLQEFGQAQQQTAAERQQMAQFQQLQSGVDQMETEFARETPDYHDAVSYLYENVAKMATAMGYPPQQVQQVISQTAMDISLRALQQGRNPAQAAYEAARSMGFTSAPDEAPPVPAATQQRKPPTSLSSVAGKRTAPGAPTWDAISKMDDTEFDAFWKQMEKSARGG